MASVTAFRRRRAWIAILVMASAVLLSATGIMSIGIAAFIGVGIVLLTRCIDASEAWGSIDGDVLILIFAMLAVGAALEQAGSVALMVGALEPVLTDAPQWAVIAIVYFSALLLSELLSNNAVAALMGPLVIGIAEATGVAPQPLLIALMLGASACFATPSATRRTRSSMPRATIASWISCASASRSTSSPASQAAPRCAFWTHDRTIGPAAIARGASPCYLRSHNDPPKAEQGVIYGPSPDFVYSHRDDPGGHHRLSGAGVCPRRQRSLHLLATQLQHAFDDLPQPDQTCRRTADSRHARRGHRAYGRQLGARPHRHAGDRVVHPRQSDFDQPRPDHGQFFSSPAPGSISPSARTRSPRWARIKKLDLFEFIEHVFPKNIFQAMADNNVLQILVFALFAGVGLTAIGEKGKPLVRGAEALAELMLQITGYVMRLAPIAVFGALAGVVAKYGLGILGTYAELVTEFYLSLVVLWVLLLGAGAIFLRRRIFL